MNYQESRAYIEKATLEYPSALGLDNMRELMKRLGNPQDHLKYVHVAGTNGKGSTIAFLYSVLSGAGYCVGRYISPTLYSYRERIEMQKERITREEFARFMTLVAQTADEMTREGLPHPTSFEMETAVAFLFFEYKKCDLVLLEVGMGGNLDATNIIHNTLLAVLVSISMDHMSFLGNTLAEIAEKKAGIIKSGCHVVTTRQKPQAEEVILKTAEACHVPCTVADAQDAQIVQESCLGQIICYQGEEYEIPLAGVYQKENAVLALNALKILNDLGFPTSAAQRKQGLKMASWKGRFTVLCQKPLFVVDGAHNPGAADMLAASIEHYFKGKRLIYIMGVFGDKDYESVIKKTVPYAEKILTIQTPDNVRALPAEELAETVRKYHPDVQAQASVEAAVKKAFSLAKEQDVILAFGSLSFIGEMTGLVEKYAARKKCSCNHENKEQTND